MVEKSKTAIEFDADELKLVQEALAQAAVPVPKAKLAAGVFEKVEKAVAELAGEKVTS